MSSLYINSGGSQKTTSSAYANIDAAQKQIFPSITYKWARYKYSTLTWEWVKRPSDSDKAIPGSSDYTMTSAYAAVGLSYSTATNIFSTSLSGTKLTISYKSSYKAQLTRDYVIGKVEELGNPDEGDMGYFSIMIFDPRYPTQQSISVDLTKSNIGSDNVAGVAIECICGIYSWANESYYSSGFYMKKNSTAWSHGIEVTDWGGSKVFDQYVTSTNRNAYPDAAQSASYYYEYVGTVS